MLCDTIDNRGIDTKFGIAKESIGIASIVTLASLKVYSTVRSHRNANVAIVVLLQYLNYYTNNYCGEHHEMNPSKAEEMHSQPS